MEDFAQYSRVYKRISRRYIDKLAFLVNGVPTKNDLIECFNKLQQQNNYNLADSLRIMRQLTLHRLIELDCNEKIGAIKVTKVMTNLAELSLNLAYKNAREQLKKLYGIPQTTQQKECNFWIVAMGKLGARELNVSSDIDLIYIYQEDGKTSGGSKASITNQEFFILLAKKIYKLIGDVTENGFVFRIDLALRPNGSEGSVAISLIELSEYFKKHAREWERFAWLKSRIVAPNTSIKNNSFKQLYEIILPFVYRRYFDFNLLETMRELHQKIGQQKGLQAVNRPQLSQDIKLSRGGIREIEFSVQTSQVIRGGTYPELRLRSTLHALQILQQLDLISNQEQQTLTEAYLFYRDVEHRIQYLDDQQSHILPKNNIDLTWLANAMGFTSSTSFLTKITSYQNFVQEYSDKLLKQKSFFSTTNSKEKQQLVENTILNFEIINGVSVQLQQHICNWLKSKKIINQTKEVQQLLQQIIGNSIDILKQKNKIQEKALYRLIGWLDAMVRRSTYLTLLVEQPKVHQRLLKILNNAKWTQKYLIYSPRVLDELSRDKFLTQRFNKQKFTEQLEQRRKVLHEAGQDDEESLLDLLRVAYRAENFKIVARDVEGQITVEQVADDLSLMADSILTIVVEWSKQFLRKKLLHKTELAIVAYGKLGGKELGYGGDLDLVFLYDDDIANQEFYIHWVRYIINWLTTRTREGELYEIDTALRPNGYSGLLTTSFTSFANYQINQGNNVAWLWEHQAITRARLVVGSPKLKRQFTRVRQQVLQTYRKEQELKQEIVAMREKLYKACYKKNQLFDLKHERTGMVDIEFAVQYLILQYSGQYPELLANLGNIALLQIAEQIGLLPKDIGYNAADAYRFYRHHQHLARLEGENPLIEPKLAIQERQAIANLWYAIFNQRLKID